MSVGKLDERNIAAYLGERGLLALEIGLRLSILVTTRRNQNFVVGVDGAPVWFVKQMSRAVPETLESLRREAACYFAASQSASSAALAALMPTCVWYDPENTILVLEYLAGANAAEAHQRRGAFDPRIAGGLGTCLGRLHFFDTATTGPLHQHLPRRLPWVLTLPAGLASARAKVLSIFHSDPRIGAVLAGLRRDYPFETLIHGDARLENFLFTGGPLGADRVRIVDWEFADLGDAAWDVASVLQHYWASLAMAQPSDTAAAGARACIDRFWTAYVEARRGVPEGERRRADLLTGARLIQTAYEWSVASGVPATALDRLGRVAHRLLTEPDPWSGLNP